MTDLDYGQFEALTFDCYGTLIDWEAGILAGLRRVLATRAVDPPDDELLEAFARVEARLESGPYLRYREILGRCVREVAADYAVAPVVAEVAAFADSVGDWPAFPIRSKRSSACSSAIDWASSPTAMTTCSPARRRASRPSSTGS